ncbi:MAG: dTMP kinase [Janthinobacterium lividum]
MAAPRGWFVTLEGGEGVGKSTQALRLERALRAAGHDVVRTREPGGSPGAEVLREMLLSGRVDWAPLAEVMLHFAARAEHVARVIRPALEAGRVVVCDRFTDSTLAYQGYGQGADLATIRALGGMLGVVPDRTVVLHASAQTQRARLASRQAAAGGGEPDRYERLGAAFHARVAEGFHAIAEAEPGRCALVSAEGGADEVEARIAGVLRFGDKTQ